MVIYNTRDWFGLIFQFHKSDTFRKLFWVLLSTGIYAWLVVYIEVDVLKLKPMSTTSMHALLGFVISMLLVFRTNTAYDRWWEGRKQWGSLVNVSRNLSFKVMAFSPKKSEVARDRLVCLVAHYAHVLKNHLRNVSIDDMKEQLPESIRPMNDVRHLPNFLSSEMQRCARDIYNEGSMAQAEYLSMINDINEFANICGACERIRNTPIPYTYSLFIKKFIFVYIITMPVAFVSDFGYWSVTATVFTFYTLASLELIAETIENPFGLDPDDLPTDEISLTIQLNVEEARDMRPEDRSRSAQLE